MRVCIQNYAMPKERDLDNTVLSLRLTSPEAARFWRIMDAAKSRNAYAGKSDIARELLGINPPTALTKDEIEFFRSGKKEVIEPPSRTLAARTQSSSRPRINAEELNRRKTGDSPHKKKTKRVA